MLGGAVSEDDVTRFEFGIHDKETAQTPGMVKGAPQRTISLSAVSFHHPVLWLCSPVPMPIPGGPSVNHSRPALSDYSKVILWGLTQESFGSKLKLIIDNISH